MTCSVCAKPCRVVRHEFVVGNLPGRPTRFIDAPMYFLASRDGLQMAAAYCGPACSTRARTVSPTPEEQHSPAQQKKED